MIALIKKLIKRKEKVKVIISPKGEIIIKSKKEQFMIKKNIKDLSEVSRKVLYIYNKLRENGELLKYPEALWLINHQYLIIIQKDKIAIRARGFEFEAKGQFVEAERSNSVGEIINLVLSRFQEVLSQLK